jgi:ABC-type Zn2+ transport system substrate-binding protein/surface adhesin
MKKMMILLVALSFVAIGCDKPAEDKTDGTHEIVNQDAHSSDHDHDDHSGHDHAHDDHAKPLGADGEMVLNNGEKWQADEHTNNSAEKMHKLVVDFKMQKEKKYDELVTKLKAEIQELVKGCTMDGAAHDQLHIWLNDYMNLVVELSDDNDEAGKEIAINNLAESLHNYSKYFK